MCVGGVAIGCGCAAFIYHVCNHFSLGFVARSLGLLESDVGFDSQSDSDFHSVTASVSASATDCCHCHLPNGIRIKDFRTCLKIFKCRKLF